MIALLESYSNEELQHCMRVSVLAVDIGTRMGLSIDCIKELTIASLLHDIGKIKIADRIINKPNSLSIEEYKAVKMHAVLGYYIVKKYKFSEEISKAILYHHENEDGTGYRNTKDIPLLAKILHVADVYDAIMYKRVYHDDRTTQETIDIMNKEQQHFNPEIYNVLKSIVLVNNTSKESA